MRTENSPVQGKNRRTCYADHFVFNLNFTKNRMGPSRSFFGTTFSHQGRVFSTKANPIFYIANVIQRSPLLQRERSDFEKAYQAHWLELQKAESRGPFNIESSHKEAIPSSSDNDKSSMTVCVASKNAQLLLEKMHELPKTSLNRRMHDKVFLVVKEAQSGVWKFPTTAYTDETFERRPSEVGGNNCRSSNAA